MSVSLYSRLFLSHNVVENRFSRFSQIRTDVWGRLKSINDLFEMAVLHRKIKQSISQTVAWAVETRYRMCNPLLLGIEEEGIGLEAPFPSDVAALVRRASEERFWLSPAEASAIELSGSVAGMALYGLSNSLLGMYAPQLSLGALLALTWGSFRWNEGEILHALSSFIESDLAFERVGFYQSRRHFWSNLFFLSAFYFFSCLYLRDRVTSEMKNKAKEQLLFYQPVIASAIICRDCLLFERNKEEILDGLPEESKSLFSQSLELLNKAIEKRDFEQMVARYKDLHQIQKLPLDVDFL